MLEIRKSTFVRSYENLFFREFSRHLYKSFKDKNLNGVLIGSPLCMADERLQIDALLITTSVVCIIDFKNFGGKIILPEENNFASEQWKNEAGEQIKGGSSINPYLQLKNQKTRFIDVAKKHILRDINHPNKFNPLHLVRVVCFQEEIELIGRIPNNESLNFFIINKSNFIEKICDIVDISVNEVFLNEESFNSFKKIFRADKYSPDDNPYEDKLKDMAAKSTKHDYSTLYEDQKSALAEIKSFLEDPEQRIFILEGTTNSGKSHIIPFIQEIAYDTGIQETEIFASSGKVAQNLMSQSGLVSVNSIYSYIYGGTSSEEDEDEKLADEEQSEKESQEISEKIPLEIVPLKLCDNIEDALFIVDESQLVSNTRYETIDLRFGSGFLLSDFIKFTDLKSSKRKIIFIGDPFQLHSGKAEDSSLNSLFYEEQYNIKAGCFQLTDKPEFSEINTEALKCVKSIRSKYYNSLQFNPGDHFTFLKNDKVLYSIENLISNDKDFHYLCFKNEDSRNINYRIKKSIINNGEDIAKGDLVLFNNNIQTEDENDPFSEPKKIYNGQFAIIESVSSEIKSETKIINKEVITLKFRELIFKLTETGNPIKVLSIENFRLNLKPELSQDEIILFKILLNVEIRKEKKKSPFLASSEFIVLSQEKIYKEFEKSDKEFLSKLINGTSRKKDLSDEEKKLKILISSSKKKYLNKIRTNFRKDPASKYYKLRNAAHLRFGWAMTVHRSTSFKWQEVILNVDQGERFGKTNASYFNWLYTGITRARNKVNLINYKPITPFDKTQLADSNEGKKPDNILFIAASEDSLLRLEEFRNFIKNKLLLSQIVIENIEHINYQERFSLNLNNQKAVISFSYDSHGKFKYPAFIKGDKVFGNSSIEFIKQKLKTFDFSVIKNNWRKEEYEKLSKILITDNIYFEYVIQTKFKDKIRLFDNENELDIEVIYNEDGAFSKITAKYYSSQVIWEKLIMAVNNIKE